jgi:hypothetical protein
MKWAGHVASMVEMKNSYKISVGKRGSKRSLEIPKRRWGDNIKMDLIQVRCEDENWIHMAQNRDQWQALLNTVMNFHVP